MAYYYLITSDVLKNNVVLHLNFKKKLLLHI